MQRVAKKYLSDSRRTKVVIEQSLGEMLKSLVKAQGDEARRARDQAGGEPRRPAQGPKAQAHRPADFPAERAAQPLLSEFPKVPREEKTLDNGLKVVVVPNSELPLVTMTLGLKSGAWTEPESPAPRRWPPR